MEFNYLLWFGQFFYFLFAVFLAFYLPGRFFLLRVKLANFERSVLSVLLGMVLWGWQGFIFGYLHLRWLTYVYLFIFLVVWLKKLTVSQFKVIRPQIDKITASIIILGSFLQLTATWFVGTNYNSGLYFCCGNSGDNTLYAAITNEIVKRFPPFESGMYGVLLQNYHYWGNLVIAELIRVFHLPIFPTSFQFIMFFLSVSLGLSGLVLAKILNLSRVFYRWLLFFLYFGSDAIFFLMLLLHRKNIFGMSSLEDGIKFLSNPSRAFAVVVFFAGLCLFVLWIKKRELKLGFIMAVIFGALIGFKVYIGIFALSGLGVLALYFLYKKEFKQLLPILLAFLLSAVIYFPVNKGAGGLYYIGFWRFENFISQPALGLLSLDMAREIFVAHNNWIKVFIYEALYVVIYISAIFGTKLIGLFQTRNTLSYLPKELHILLITGITVSFVAGIFFEQTSGGSNTFNFLVSVFIIGSLYTALVSMDWTKRLPKHLQ